MAIDDELKAQILRYHFVEHWRVGTRMNRGYSRTRGILNAAASGSLTAGSTVQDQLRLGSLAARSR